MIEGLIFFGREVLLKCCAFSSTFLCSALGNASALQGAGSEVPPVTHEKGPSSVGVGFESRALEMCLLERRPFWFDGFVSRLMSDLCFDAASWRWKCLMQLP